MKSNKNCNCDKLVKRKVTDTISIAGRMVKVENVPVLVCQDCGEIHFEGRYLINLEKDIISRERKAA